MKEYDWLEFKYRPLKDGLHDSGYRFIQLTGAWYERDESGNRVGEPKKEPLHQWSDHVVLEGPVNIDVERDGTIRIMHWPSRRGWVNRDGEAMHYLSSAMFESGDPEEDIKYLQAMVEVRRKVAADMKKWGLEK